jgi:hypothetical protein
LAIILPIISLTLYGFTTFFLIRRVKLESKVSGIYLTEFPKKRTILLGIIAFFLPLATNKLSGLYAEYVLPPKNLEMSEYLNFYGWFNIGLGASHLLILMVLIIIFFNKLKKL